MSVLEAVEGSKCKVIRRFPTSGKVVPKRAVVVTVKVWKGFREAQTQSQAQLLVSFEQWCNGKPLPDSKHKRNEGRYSQGGRTILLQAFAAPGVRLYGWIEVFDGVEAFLLVEYDVNKKQQKADQDLLKESGRKSFSLQKEIREKLDAA